MKRVAMILFAFVLVVAACGDDDDGSDGVTAGDDPAAVADEPTDDAPAISSLCTEDEPDCDDTVEPGNEPVDGVDEPGDEPVTSSGVLVDGGLTISDALDTDATGVLAVKGFLFVENDEIRLCEALAESFPPQCGGAVLTIDAPSVDALTFDDEVPLNSAQGVTWTDFHITLLGELDGETLVVDPLVTG